MKVNAQKENYQQSNYRIAQNVLCYYCFKISF